MARPEGFQCENNPFHAYSPTAPTRCRWCGETRTAADALVSLVAGREGWDEEMARALVDQHAAESSRPNPPIHPSTQIRSTPMGINDSNIGASWHFQEGKVITNLHIVDDTDLSDESTADLVITLVDALDDLAQLDRFDYTATARKVAGLWREVKWRGVVLH
ncbi:hypothetical protein [Streptomyces sp. NPDC059278]|uniref:hypothetical protein n=1 Tax=Streptomyces sp. NPDC059278 TaxID=3346801 RepID=UPI0036A756B7